VSTVYIILQSLEATAMDISDFARPRESVVSVEFSLCAIIGLLEEDFASLSFLVVFELSLLELELVCVANSCAKSFLSQVHR